MQEFDALLPRENIDFHHLSMTGPYIIPRSQEDVPGTGRKEFTDVPRIVGIVEYDKPAVESISLLERGENGSYRIVYREELQVHARRNVGYRGAYHGRLFGGNPADQIVFALVTIYVFNGQMCLSYATVTVQGMRNERGHFAGEPLADIAEQLFPAGEILIPRGDSGPYDGECAAPPPARAFTRRMGHVVSSERYYSGSTKSVSIGGRPGAG